MHSQLTVPSVADLANWKIRLPWLMLALVSLGGLLLTAAGSAIAVGAHLSPVASIYVVAGFVTASALVGAAIMRLSRYSLRQYGFRRPAGLSSVLWGVPLLAAPLIVALTTGVAVNAALIPAYLLLTIAVAFNEEIWFRGLALASVRRFGERTAIIASSTFFGLLHLANAGQGKSALYLALQVLLAFLVGVVLSEIVELTGSLWIGIGWHLVYDFTAYLGGDVLTPSALVGIALIDVILAGFALWLWRRLPTTSLRGHLAR